MWFNKVEGLCPCVVLWFKQVRKSRTTPNSCQSTLRSLFRLELRGLKWFGKVEPPRTHVKLHRRIESMRSTTIRTGLEESNLSELVRNYSIIFVPSGAQSFEVVRLGRTTHNSCQISQQDWIELLYCGSNRFGRVETP